MVWVYVGMSNRLPLPCCVYSVMRSAFPIAEDQYHGYEEEDEDELYCSKRKNTSLFSMNGWRYSFQPSKRMIKVVLRENCEVPTNIVIQRLDFTIFMSSLFSFLIKPGMIVDFWNRFIYSDSSCSPNFWQEINKKVFFSEKPVCSPGPGCSKIG